MANNRVVTNTHPKKTWDTDNLFTSSTFTMLVFTFEISWLWQSRKPSAYLVALNMYTCCRLMLLNGVHFIFSQLTVEFQSWRTCKHTHTHAYIHIEYVFFMKMSADSTTVYFSTLDLDFGVNVLSDFMWRFCDAMMVNGSVCACVYLLVTDNK